MKSTFLIELDLDDISPLALAEASEDIHDAVEKTGFEVHSVKPWAHPVTAPAVGLFNFQSSLPEQTNTTKQT